MVSAQEVLVVLVRPGGCGRVGGGGRAVKEVVEVGVGGRTVAG